jgi:hypothetical protein
LLRKLSWLAGLGCDKVAQSDSAWPWLTWVGLFGGVSLHRSKLQRLLDRRRAEVDLAVGSALHFGFARVRLVSR